MASSPATNRIVRYASTLWKSPRFEQWRAIVTQWHKAWYSGALVLIIGTIIATLIVMALDNAGIVELNPGLVYLPLVALLAYHWNWRYALIATLLQLTCVYFLFIPPDDNFKSLATESATQLITLAAVTVFVLALVQLARQRRSMAVHEAARFEALNRVGTALASELDETRLLHLIAETARNLTGAAFAAFTLRPLDELGEPATPSEGIFFYLAAVVGVTAEQEELFRHMRLGGEGLLAPIFRHSTPVLVGDALDYIPRKGLQGKTIESRDAARQAAFDYAHGQLARENLRSMGVPHGHPLIRSFLGAPLLDRSGQVRGGLLLGHSEPNRFTQEDQALLVGLAAEAAVALENARLYSAAQTQAEELDAIFESIADGVILVNNQGKILRENRAARHMHKIVNDAPESDSIAEALLQTPAAHALHGLVEQGTSVTLIDGQHETREYLVSSSPLRQTNPASGPLSQNEQNGQQEDFAGAVVVWHDATEARRLLLERQAHAETEARRSLLQTLIDELPSGVYLVRGQDARLVLANRAADEVWGASWQYNCPMSDFLQTNGIRVFSTDGRPLAPDELATLRAVQKGESAHHRQETIRHPDGTALPVLLNAVALDAHVLGSSADSQNDEPGAIVVLQDVTALKEAERLKDEFIGIAAHELRNPLAVLRGFAQMLIIQTARGKGPQLADWQTEAIRDIDQATSRLVELTEDLLDVTRLQGGRLELHMEPTDIVALTHRVITRLQVTTERHTISMHATRADIVVNADRRRIEQVLTNIINNAIKYSPDGGTIDITARVDAEAGVAMLCVRDHGIGIPAQQQARIFGRFMRADNAKAREIGGTGLGLYITRELIERHAGRIWFESAEGQGSTFFITLPLALV